MNDANIHKIFSAQLSDPEFEKLSKFIFSNYGIKMPPEKKIMLQSRLQKRLRMLQIDSFKEYVDYVFSKEGAVEIIHMIDVVSTNKTDFYREIAHFEYLQSTVLPEFVTKNRFMKLWSAGCSSGPEVYTLAIVLSEFAQSNPGFDFSILGTDISTQMLKKASAAIYPEDMVNMMSIDLKRKYLLKSKDKEKKLVRVNKTLRSKAKFQRLNFMDTTYSSVNEKFDVIFCRNVLIYFDRETQENVINKLCTHIPVGGFFFLGHSESITNIDVPLKQLRPTIYTKI